MLYIIGSDNAGEDVPSEDKFKYKDDLATLEAVKIQNKLIHYEYLKHVPSDIPTQQRFLSVVIFSSQHIIDDIVVPWTTNNKMKLNVAKTKYMVLSRSHEELSTRLTIHQNPIERTHEMIQLGVWVTLDLTWGKKHYRDMQTSLFKNKYVNQAEILWCSNRRVN